MGTNYFTTKIRRAVRASSRREPSLALNLKYARVALAPTPKQVLRSTEDSPADVEGNARPTATCLWCSKIESTKPREHPPSVAWCNPKRPRTLLRLRVPATPLILLFLSHFGATIVASYNLHESTATPVHAAPNLVSPVLCDFFAVHLLLHQVQGAVAVKARVHPRVPPNLRQDEGAGYDRGAPHDVIQKK